MSELMGPWTTSPSRISSASQLRLRHHQSRLPCEGKVLAGAGRVPLTSGAMLSGVPQKVLACLSPDMFSLHMPKSAILMWPVWSSNTLSSLRSLRGKDRRTSR